MDRQPTMIDVARLASVPQSTVGPTLQHSLTAKQSTRHDLCRDDVPAHGPLARCVALHGKGGPPPNVTGLDDIKPRVQAFPALSAMRRQIAGLGCRMAEAVPNWPENGLYPASGAIRMVARTGSFAK